MPFAIAGFVAGQMLGALSVAALIPIYIPLATLSYVSWTWQRGSEKAGPR